MSRSGARYTTGQCRRLVNTWLRTTPGVLVYRYGPVGRGWCRANTVLQFQTDCIAVYYGPVMGADGVRYGEDVEYGQTTRHG